MDKIYEDQKRLVRAQDKIIDKLVSCHNMERKQKLRSTYMQIIILKEKNREKLKELWTKAEKESSLTKSSTDQTE